METTPVPPSSRIRYIVLIGMALFCVALISWAGSLNSVEAESEAEVLETAAPMAAAIFPLAGQE